MLGATKVLLHRFSVKEPISPLLHICWKASNKYTPLHVGTLHERLRKSPEHLWLGRNRRTSSEKTLRLWIDAICINQADEVEKACQIPLMTKIYANAQRVLVWLGPAAAGSEELLDNLDHLIESLQSVVGLPQSTDEGFTAAGLPPLSASIWSSAAEFLSRPWFRRLWVIQEVVLARKVLLICGDRSVDFMTLSEFVGSLDEALIFSWILAKARRRRHAEHGRYFILNLGDMHRELGDTRRNLVYILDMGREAEVREPVDRVYGLLGLMEEKHQQAITINYSPKARQEYHNLYIDIARHLVETRNLDFLLLAESVERPLMLPSWVPNWNGVKPTPTVGDHFSAGFYKDGLLQTFDNMFPNPTSIQLCGLQLVTITATASLVSNDGREKEAGATRTLKSIEDSSLIYSSDLASGKDEETMRCFARALIGDRGLWSRDGCSQRYQGDCLEDFNWYVKYLKYWINDDDEEVFQHWAMEHMNRYMVNLISTWQHRCFFVTDNGHFGLASLSCRPGDKMCIIFDTDHPFVLRPV